MNERLKKYLEQTNEPDGENIRFEYGFSDGPCCDDGCCCLCDDEGCCCCCCESCNEKIGECNGICSP